MREVVQLDKNEFLTVNGIFVRSVEIATAARVNIKISTDKIISLLLNKYSSEMFPEKEFSEEGKDYYTGLLRFNMTELELDFVVEIKKSNLVIIRIEVVI